MSIRFACKECGEPYEVRDQDAGRTIRCRDCGAHVVVPSESTRRFVRGSLDTAIQQFVVAAAVAIAVLFGSFVSLVLMVRDGFSEGWRSSANGNEDRDTDRFAPKPSLKSQLTRDFQLDRYVLRFPPGFTIAELETEEDPWTGVRHDAAWRGPPGAFTLRVTQRGEFRNPLRRPTIDVGPMGSGSTNALLAYSHAEVDETRIGEFPATRILVDHDRKTYSMGPSYDGGPRQFVYVIFDEDRCIQMSGSVPGSFDSDGFKRLESIAHSLRRVKPNESIPAWDRPRDR